MDHAMFPSLSLYIAVLQSRAAQFPKGNNRPSLRLSPAESLYASRHRLYTLSQHTHTTHCVCVCLYLFEWILLLGIVSSCLMSFYFLFSFPVDRLRESWLLICSHHGRMAMALDSRHLLLRSQRTRNKRKHQPLNVETKSKGNKKSMLVINKRIARDREIEESGPYSTSIHNIV